LEPRDELTLTASASLKIEDGKGPADFTSEFSLAAEWEVNTFLALALRGEYELFDGGTPDSDYQDARLIASLILQR
jgi:hypothetical protein